MTASAAKHRACLMIFNVGLSQVFWVCKTQNSGASAAAVCCLTF
jgi:hypothetical protein